MSRRSTRLVFTVRRLEPRMGVENLVEAARLLDDIPELRVVIAGAGRRRELETLRERLAPRASVELDRSGARRRAAACWYRAADLFVLPSVAYEGFGLVTAEALASGTPVVGTRCGRDAGAARAARAAPPQSRHGSRGSRRSDSDRPRLATPGFPRAVSRLCARALLVGCRPARVGARARRDRPRPGAGQRARSQPSLDRCARR